MERPPRLACLGRVPVDELPDGAGEPGAADSRSDPGCPHFAAGRDRRTVGPPQAPRSAQSPRASRTLRARSRPGPAQSTGQRRPNHPPTLRTRSSSPTFPRLGEPVPTMSSASCFTPSHSVYTLSPAVSVPSPLSLAIYTSAPRPLRRAPALGTSPTGPRGKLALATANSAEGVDGAACVTSTTGRRLRWVAGGTVAGTDRPDRAGCQIRVDPSSVMVQPGLCATSHT
jgi:hypothetical protein